MTTAAPLPAAEAVEAPPAWLGLLGRFYARAGLPLPRLRLLEGSEVPEPYRSLLVHSRDMTPTLERFHRQPIRLIVLRRERQEGTYWREVVLRRAQDGRPVEYGVIRICLTHLSAAAAQRVLEEGQPLGKILELEAVAHLSWPQAFFRIEANARMGAVLRLRAPGALYGRRNVLLDATRRLLAEVIEILPT